MARFIRDRACINDHLSIFFDMNGQFTLNNYLSYFTSGTSLSMTINSVWYAFLITFFTLIISYPTAYFLTKLKHKQLWLMLIILPTWVNLLLKAYAFIGIFSVHGSVNHFLILSGSGRNRYYSQTSVFCSWQRISRFHL